MSVDYKVPRILWESLETVLLAQSRKYVAELAKRLSVSEKELIKQVLPTKDSLKVYIQDSKSETNMCNAYIQQDKITSFCKNPTAYCSEFCTFHKAKRMTVIKDMLPHHIEKIKDRNDLNPTWKGSKNDLINSKGEIIGKINQNNYKIKIYILPE
jgi:hypothetical protein